MSGPPGTLQRKRGRKSTGDAFVLIPDVALRPPDPPAGFTADEQTLFRELVLRLRPGHFYTSEHLLQAYVRTIAMVSTLDHLIEAEEAGSKQHLDLLTARARQVALLTVLATKLRISPKSSTEPKAPHISPVPRGVSRPWELPSREA